MKSVFKNLSLAAALFSAAIFTPEVQAADVTLDGFGYYSVGNRVRFYPNGTQQSGRYRNLGSDYYHRARIEIEYITNRSNSRTGTLSFEFWAMPFYDATSGIILMTRAKDPLSPRGSYRDASKEGNAISLGARRFPELNLWEYTRSGWRFRDSLTFTRPTYL